MGKAGYLRRQAERARWHARQLNDRGAVECLLDYAREMERDADLVEFGGSESARREPPRVELNSAQ